MQLTLVRHTSLDVLPGICYGQSDIHVSSNFENEAQVIFHKLQNQEFDVVYSSPLQRCVKLAEYQEIFCAKTDERLMEMNFGDWELQVWDDIDDPQLQIWFDNWVEETPTNGESLRQLLIRVQSFLDELRQLNYKRVLVFCHAGVIRAMDMIINKKSIEAVFRTQIEFGEISKLNLGKLNLL